MEPTYPSSLRDRLDALAERSRRMQEALAGVEATVSSRDGAVTATAGPTGELRRLVLGERSSAMSRVQLAAAVLATVAQAQAEAALAMAEVIGPPAQAR